MSVDNSQANIVAAGALWFATVVIITFCAIFENSLFLSTYPVQYIPYYMITSVPVLFFSVLLISPILAEASNRLVITILLIAMMVVGGLLFVLQYSLYWFPFVLRLLLAIVKVTLTIISMSVISSSMRIREFKQKFGKIAVGGSLGGIVAGYLAMPLTKFFGLNSLLYIVTLTFLLCIYCIMLLPAKVAKQKSRIGVF